MNFIIWIFQSVLAALRMITDKKVANNKAIWNDILIFLSRGWHILFLIVLILFWIFDFNIPKENINLINFLILITSSVMIYFIFFLRKVSYSNEKVTVLQPFAMLAQVFPIIFWFIFIMAERENLITFLSALLASLIVIWTSIDYKNFKINKYSLLILFSSILKAIQVFAIIYLLDFVSPVTYYILESIIMFVISIFIIIWKKQTHQIKFFTKSYTKLFILANFITLWAILLNLMMYKSLWIILTSLISLLYLIFVFIFSKLILKEKIWKKNIIISVVVAICIVVWMLFKH